MSTQPEQHESAPLFLRAIFHVHTIHSRDSSMSPDALVQRAIDYGVDALAVTDHNEIDGAFDVARRAPFQVIVGEEARTKEGGEIIGLYLTERIAANLPAAEVIRRIRDQGGLVYLPHPFDRARNKTFSDAMLEEMAPAVDIVETFNARNLNPASNAHAKAFAERHGKTTCAGADAHVAAEIGPTFVELPPFSSPQELLSSLRASRSTEQRTPLLVRAAAVLSRVTRQPPERS